MPPRCPSKNNSKKQKTKYDFNKKASELAKYNKQNDYFFNKTICISLFVKVDETGGFSGIFNPTYDINKPDKKICSLYSTFDRNKIKPTKVLSNHLVALNESKKHEIYGSYIILQNASGFGKNAKIGKVTFNYIIEYKEIFLDANTPLDNETDNEYEYFGNEEMMFDNYEQDLTPDIIIID
ncbi:17848_t:CDS:2 [Cetraspora pellucida]|uniref:17848_t:CDS:1 n=1 Tax=Cetraspora pellucida TaxID=1433469 RepID=A0A9N8VVW3_9GLOM|nr:17848_t:CDS:2 [Cetraspora pellucida]